MAMFREATAADLPTIVALLADDPLGAERETPDDLARYEAAFSAIEADPNNKMCVAEGPDGVVIGCLQITVIPGLSRGGMLRGQIESVRIARESRGQGIGELFFLWAVGQCRAKGCKLVQLTSDTSRMGAQRFYARHGFVASHTGWKLAF